MHLWASPGKNIHDNLINEPKKKSEKLERRRTTFVLTLLGVNWLPEGLFFDWSGATISLPEDCAVCAVYHRHSYVSPVDHLSPSRSQTFSQPCPPRTKEYLSLFNIMLFCHLNPPKRRSLSTCFLHKWFPRLDFRRNYFGSPFFSADNCSITSVTEPPGRIPHSEPFAIPPSPARKWSLRIFGVLKPEDLRVMKTSCYRERFNVW